MILFVLTGQAPPILVLTLVVMAYLTGYELWKEGRTCRSCGRRGGSCSCCC